MNELKKMIEGCVMDGLGNAEEGKAGKTLMEHMSVCCVREFGKKMLKK